MARTFCHTTADIDFLFSHDWDRARQFCRPRKQGTLEKAHYCHIIFGQLNLCIQEITLRIAMSKGWCGNLNHAHYTIFRKPISTQIVKQIYKKANFSRRNGSSQEDMRPTITTVQDNRSHIRWRHSYHRSMQKGEILFDKQAMLDNTLLFFFKLEAKSSFQTESTNQFFQADGYTAPSARNS